MSIRSQAWGEAYGEPVTLFTVETKTGMRVGITDFGARITELRVPDKHGVSNSIVLGFDNLASYLQPEPYLGCTVGRCANRIAGASFNLDGRTYPLIANNGPNCLHGGKRGFDKRIWKSTVKDDTLTFSYLSPDGEEGFPGTVSTTVTYTFGAGNEVNIAYEAVTDLPTLVNLTNHSYFNLKGAGRGNILDHQLQLQADHYNPVNDVLIPTGELRPVRGTPFDFTSPRAIGSRISETGGGYDHNFCLRGSGTNPAIILSEATSGLSLEIATSQPGVQVYTGNGLDGTLSGIGGRFEKYGAVAIETQHYPDSIHQPTFPSTVLRPGQTYNHWISYRIRRMS